MKTFSCSVLRGRLSVAMKISALLVAAALAAACGSPTSASYVVASPSRPATIAVAEAVTPTATATATAAPTATLAPAPTATATAAPTATTEDPLRIVGPAPCAITGVTSEGLIQNAHVTFCISKASSHVVADLTGETDGAPFKKALVGAYSGGCYTASITWRNDGVESAQREHFLRLTAEYADENFTTGRCSILY